PDQPRGRRRLGGRVTRAALYVGDALEVLRTLPDESVQCCVTSPPYWGLRDYGAGTWEGGAEDCDHLQKVGGTRNSTLGEASGGHAISDEARVRSTTRSFVPFAGECRKCGATRVDHQLGLEATPEEYVAKLVEVLQEVRRVLREDGTLWLNIGDRYAHDRSGGHGATGGLGSSTLASPAPFAATPTRRPFPVGLKPKDLVGIPWRVAFALQADRWYLRSDIIWSKPNPMPESVTDRPTKAHEYVFLLSKSQRYHYDANSIKTPATAPTTKMPDGWDTGPGAHGSFHRNGREKGRKTDKQRGHGRRHAGFNDRWDSISKAEQQVMGANARSVWTIATKPYPNAHFATFPPELAARCILAGSTPGDTVLDPFGGSGTTASVATGLGRNAIHIDLKPEYLD
ncbi:hypothetical protein LCGC14_2845950, partial [marine sediment metagenome]